MTTITEILAKHEDENLWISLLAVARMVNARRVPNKNLDVWPLTISGLLESGVPRDQVEALVKEIKRRGYEYGLRGPRWHQRDAPDEGIFLIEVMEREWGSEDESRRTS